MSLKMYILLAMKLTFGIASNISYIAKLEKCIVLIDNYDRCAKKGYQGVLASTDDEAGCSKASSLESLKRPAAWAPPPASLLRTDSYGALSEFKSWAYNIQ